MAPSIDEKGRFRRDFIASKGYRSVLVYDLFRLVEASWLAAAIGALDYASNRNIIARTYRKEKLNAEFEIIPSRDEILAFVLDQNLYPTILTDSDCRFAAYFSEHRDYFLVCGDDAFLKAAYPVDNDTIEKQYFENLELEALRAPVDKAGLISIWEFYNGTGTAR